MSGDERVNPGAFERVDEHTWRLPPRAGMHVPALIHASEAQLRRMEVRVIEQLCNVARLPGIVEAAHAMPDARSGYGFPIGSVAAFGMHEGGVVSAGGVGFDIGGGVRLLRTGLTVADLEPWRQGLAEALAGLVPGRHGGSRMTVDDLDALLTGGARWAVGHGYGTAEDLDRIDSCGCFAGAEPQSIPVRARAGERSRTATPVTGHRSIEVQRVAEIYHAGLARGYGLASGELVLSLYAGSDTLGHQVATDYLGQMLEAAPGFGIRLPDRELACAPLWSVLGRRYLGAMWAACNDALATRQILTHRVREVFAERFPAARLPILYDHSYNTCRKEVHWVGGKARELYLHRKGVMRALGPGHADLPPDLQVLGQPVIVGGRLGAVSYVMAGCSAAKVFGSVCRGDDEGPSGPVSADDRSGRSSRNPAVREDTAFSVPWRGSANDGQAVCNALDAVVVAAERAGLARRVARLEPLVSIKG